VTGVGGATGLFSPAIATAWLAKIRSPTRGTENIEAIKFRIAWCSFLRPPQAKRD
jgi:hypothetical protein